MDRRSFLLGLCGAAVAGTGAAALLPIVASPAEATPLDALKNLPPLDEAGEGEAYGAAPDGTPADSTYWVWRNGRRVWVAPRRRRRRRVCRRVRVNGIWRQRCWWQYY